MQTSDFLGLVVAAAAGYTVCKLIEAEAHDVPWEVALRNPHKSVLILRAGMDASNPNIAGISGLGVRRLQLVR